MHRFVRCHILLALKLICGLAIVNGFSVPQLARRSINLRTESSSLLIASLKQHQKERRYHQLQPKKELQIILHASEDKNNDNNDLNSDWGEEGGSGDEKDGNIVDGIIGGIKNWFQSEEGQDDIKTYLVSLVIALCVRFTIVEPRFIPSLSMFPTFDIGDQLAVEKVTKRIKPFYRNEVVVFRPPQAFKDIIVNNYGQSPKSREALIKRVVAIEGDTVKIRGGKLFINNVEQEEPFTAEDAAYEFGPVVVPPGNVLVLGDNRNQSLDGHIWGFLPGENVIGRAVFVYWPPWRVGNTGMY